MIKPDGRQGLSVRRQCEILFMNRSSFYYTPVPVSAKDKVIMSLIDEIFTESPFYGARKISLTLKQRHVPVGRKRVASLMRLMGLEAVFPKKNLSKPHPNHRIYPYLLRGVEIVRINQVWSTDITYIRLKKGFVYLAAIIDWNSRYVLSYRLSNTLTSDFCVEALNEALQYGTPEIFNTDQGSQFTSDEFIAVLKKNNIAISMDGRGRAFDNIFIERLWRSVKYENVYLKGYETIPDAQAGLNAYFNFYNTQRHHQSLGYKTPWLVYSGLEVDQNQNLIA